VMFGLWSGFIIGIITEIFTSNAYSPVQELAEACHMGAAPNIILGLALGYMSTIVPIICIAVTIFISFTFAGMYGIALAALGMLGCLPIALSIDGYGPISDNAGGIAEMAQPPNTSELLLTSSMLPETPLLLSAKVSLLALPALSPLPFSVPS